jgi:hypothetical protein
MLSPTRPLRGFSTSTGLLAVETEVACAGCTGEGLGVVPLTPAPPAALIGLALEVTAGETAGFAPARGGSTRTLLAMPEPAATTHVMTTNKITTPTPIAASRLRNTSPQA